MEIEDYIEIKSNIQRIILEFVDNENNCEYYIYKLNSLLNNLQIPEDQYEFISIFRLILKIANNHHRTPTFFCKIEKILFLFKDEIKKNFSNSEIFNIFKSNKRIILFLIEQGIIIPDKCIADTMMQMKYINSKYPIYFYNEFKQFFDENKEFQNNFKDEIQEINNNSSSYFTEKRKIGENHHFLSELIRNDSIEEFISFSNRTNLCLSSTIKPSIYETNSLLIKKEPTLIEYSVFFGSIQIFKYLYLNNVELTSSLWIYAIHGKNPEIIHVLEEKNVEPHDASFKECLSESIKCHHNEIANYILNNLLSSFPDVDLLISSNGIKYNNYEYFPDNLRNLYFLDELCRFNYVPIVNLLINNKNINAKIIQNKQIFLIKFLFIAFLNRIAKYFF